MADSKDNNQSAKERKPCLHIVWSHRDYGSRFGECTVKGCDCKQYAGCGK